MILDYLKFSFFKLIRNKKNRYFTFLFVILTCFLMSSLTFHSIFNIYINDTIKKNIGFRTLSVAPDMNKDDYGYEALTKIEHVQDVHSSYYDFASVKSSFELDGLDGYIDLVYGNNGIMPKNIIGESFDGNETGVAVCPINFYPSSDAFNLFIDEKKVLNGYDLLGMSFDILYYSYYFDGKVMHEDEKFTKTFKIVGLYDAETVMNPSNTCYISELDIKEIKDVGKFESENSAYGFMAVVDDVDNISYVLEELENLGFLRTTIRSEIDSSIVNIIILSSNIVTAVIMTSIILLMMNYIKKKSINDAKNIGILRASGYKNKNITFISLMEVFCASIFSYFLGIVLFIIIFLILRTTLLSSLTYSGFQIKTYLIDYFFTFFVMVVFSLIIMFFNVIKNKNANIVDLVRSE